MRVGVTGHQNLGPKSAVKWLSTVLTNAIKEYNVQEGVTCLAIGADQLYADILNKDTIPYIAVIPSNHYEQTFKNKSHYENYLRLLSNAHRIIKLKFDRPDQTAFFEAGKEVVRLSEVIFAIWDGKKAKGLGGTADIVKYAMSNRKKVVHFNPITYRIT